MIIELPQKNYSLRLPHFHPAIEHIHLFYFYSDRISDAVLFLSFFIPKGSSNRIKGELFSKTLPH